MQNRLRQAGLTLIEIGAGLALLAIITAGPLSLYQVSRSGQLASSMNSNLASIRQSIRMVKQAQGSYGTASLNATLIAGNRVPPDMMVSGSTISTPYGGTVTITGATTAFSIVVTTVPRAACVALLMAADIGWASLQVGTTVASTTFPISPTVANDNTHCGAAAETYTLTYVSS